MAIENLEICLRGWAYGKTTNNFLFATLDLKDEDGWRSESGATVSQSALIYFVEENISSYKTEGEPSEVLAVSVERKLQKAAEWILSREPNAFEKCRLSGLNVDIFIGGWINQDQIDLTLSATFLQACGQAGLKIVLVTND